VAATKQSARFVLNFCTRDL